MRAHGKRAGGGFEFYNRAEKKTFAVDAVGVKLLRIGQFCFLRPRGNAKRKCDPKRKSASHTLSASHCDPFPLARIPPGIVCVSNAELQSIRWHDFGQGFPTPAPDFLSRNTLEIAALY